MIIFSGAPGGSKSTLKQLHQCLKKWPKGGKILGEGGTGQIGVGTGQIRDFGWVQVKMGTGQMEGRLTH